MVFDTGEFEICLLEEYSHVLDHHVHELTLPVRTIVVRILDDRAGVLAISQPFGIDT